ncbi:CAP domain-containing protein [Paenibacillus albiflavus]|nr:CAP domain-containing protein [Paenibacillus albiflavus]
MSKQPQQPPNQTKVETRARSATPPSNLTQASSIATPNAGKQSITIKQLPNSNSSWIDWFNRNLGSRENPNNQIAFPPMTQIPSPQPTSQTQIPQPTSQTQYPQPTNQTHSPQPPSQTPSQTPNPGQSADSSQFAQQVLDLVNQERSKAGLQPLTMNSALSKMAMDKAQDMINNNYFDHQSPTYGSPFDMMRSYGINYSTAGENIAKGQSSPTEVMNAWMNSPGHRANILGSGFTQIGIAYYNRAWVQEFIG